MAPFTRELSKHQPSIEKLEKKGVHWKMAQENKCNPGILGKGVYRAVPLEQMGTSKPAEPAFLLTDLHRRESGVSLLETSPGPNSGN